MAQYHRELFETKGRQFVLRSAEEADAAKMLDYMEHVDRETTFLAREPGEFGQTITMEKERELLESWKNDPHHLFLVAEEEHGEIAATCNCTFSTRRQRTAHKAELAISVRQDFWRMGLGRRLLEIQESWCRQQGLHKLALEVDTTNTRALGLYLSQGFVIEGTLLHEARLPDGTWRDWYHMGKILE